MKAITTSIDPQINFAIHLSLCTYNHSAENKLNSTRNIISSACQNVLTHLHYLRLNIGSTMRAYRSIVTGVAKLDKIVSFSRVSTLFWCEMWMKGLSSNVECDRSVSELNIEAKGDSSIQVL